MTIKKKAIVKKRSSAKDGRRPSAEGLLNFTELVAAIRHVHEQSASFVNRTVNTTLTLRNWLIGGYIHHYELTGLDRAKCGDGLIDRLAEELNLKGVTACDRIRLYLYLSFFRTYPQILDALQSTGLPEALGVPLQDSPIVRSPTEQSTQTAKYPKVRSVSEQSPSKPIVLSLTAQSAFPGKELLDRLSFSHFEQLIAIDDPLKRAFYEIECIRGNWSVRALKRQIATLYFERSGLSKDKEKLAAMVKKGVETEEPKLAIRDPYIFEVLGLRAI